MRDMLTTILVNFNHAQYLPDSLASILAQTRPADELIVIDDASTDQSVEVITHFLRAHRNVRLIRNPENQGCFANMNDGLRVAHGNYIHFAAADDVFYPWLYATALELLIRCRHAALFSSRSDVIDQNGCDRREPTPWLGYPLRAPGFIPPAQVRRLLMQQDGWFMGNTIIFHRHKVLELGGFPENLQSFADGYICRLLALKWGACFSPDVLAAWRRLDGGLSQSVAASPQEAKSVIIAAERQMRSAGPIFPSHYIKRWKGRQEFDIRRRALARARAERAATAGVLGRAIATMTEKFRATALLLRLRPWDVGVNIRQHLQLYFGQR